MTESVKDMQKGQVWKDWGSGKECTWESGWAGFVVTTMLDQLWPKLEEVYKSWPLGGMQGVELEFGGLDTNVSYRMCGMCKSSTVVRIKKWKLEKWNLILKILMISIGAHKWLTNGSFNFNGFWFLWEVTDSCSIDGSYSENITLFSGQAMTDKPA